MTKPHESCTTDIKHISVKHKELCILNDVSITLRCGEFTALVGANGAGKSTLLRALVGEIGFHGEISFKGKARRPRTGYVPQKIAFASDNPATVLDLFYVAYAKGPVWLFKAKGARARALEVLRRCGAEAILERKLGALSGGEMRRALLALALFDQPELLILDEPGAGMDRNGLERFYSLISDIRKEHDLSILMVSHDFLEVRDYVDRVFLLDRGRLEAEGAPRDVFASDSFIRIFGQTMAGLG